METEPLYRCALTIGEKVLCPNHLDVATSFACRHACIELLAVSGRAKYLNNGQLVAARFSDESAGCTKNKGVLVIGEKEFSLKHADVPGYAV